MSELNGIMHAQLTYMLRVYSISRTCVVLLQYNMCNGWKCSNMCVKC